jgi:hypothetical protein
MIMLYHYVDYQGEYALFNVENYKLIFIKKFNTFISLIDQGSRLYCFAMNMIIL